MAIMTHQLSEAVHRRIFDEGQGHDDDEGQVEDPGQDGPLVGVVQLNVVRISSERPNIEFRNSLLLPLNIGILYE